MTEKERKRVSERDREGERQCVSANLSRSHSRALLEFPLEETRARLSSAYASTYDVCTAVDSDRRGEYIGQQRCARRNEKVVAVALRIGNDDAGQTDDFRTKRSYQENEGGDSSSGTLNRARTGTRSCCLFSPCSSVHLSVRTSK